MCGVPRTHGVSLRRRRLGSLRERGRRAAGGPGSDQHAPRNSAAETVSPRRRRDGRERSEQRVGFRSNADNVGRRRTQPNERDTKRSSMAPDSTSRSPVATFVRDRYHRTSERSSYRVSASAMTVGSEVTAP